MKENFDIVEYIPVGHAHAVSRKSLSIQTGLSDRKVRREIAHAGEKHAILNMQDSAGYYRPDMTDPHDVEACYLFFLQERSRIRSIAASMRGVSEALKIKKFEGTADLS